MNHPKTYHNWTENLSNRVPIKYPKNDGELAQLCDYAMNNNKRIRMVGNSHSLSPVVSNIDEDLILVSLGEYSLPGDNIKIDRNSMTVSVNAGWTLGQLYDELNKGLYFLETQTAGSVFTVAGAISTPVHGGRLGGSLIADSVVGLRIMDDNGQLILKTDKDEDFSWYRLNLGLFGIITQVRLKIHQMLDVESTISHFEEVFIDRDGKTELNPELQPYFRERINYCLGNSGDVIFSTENQNLLLSDTGVVVDEEVLNSRARYNHAFIDYHNNEMLSLDWKELYEVRENRKDEPEARFADKVSNFIHRKLFPRYRENENYLKAMGKFVGMNIHYAAYLNSLKDQDMFWVELGTRVYFMSYFIPVHTEGEEFDWRKVAEPLEIVKRTIQQFNSENRLFTIDLPLDIRFVTSSSNVPVSPIYSEGPKTVYMTVDLTTGQENIHLDEHPEDHGCCVSRQFKTELNADFRLFYNTIETEWKKLGGLAHWGKLFGSRTDPEESAFFEFEAVNSVFSSDVKSRLKEKAKPLFRNDFMLSLLSEAPTGN